MIGCDAAEKLLNLIIEGFLTLPMIIEKGGIK